MSARDRIHRTVRRALIKDGWTITHDPFPLELEGEFLETDLAAEQSVAAERSEELIAVEVKSFIRDSLISDFEAAVGQYLVYRLILSKREPERKLYLGVSDLAYETLIRSAIVRLVIEEFSIPLIIVDQFAEEIVRWIP